MKKKIFTLLSTLILLFFNTPTAFAQSTAIVGDMNNDGKITIDDVTLLIGTALGEIPKMELTVVSTTPTPSVDKGKIYYNFPNIDPENFNFESLVGWQYTKEFDLLDDTSVEIEIPEPDEYIINNSTGLKDKIQYLAIPADYELYKVIMGGFYFYGWTYIKTTKIGGVDYGIYFKNRFGGVFIFNFYLRKFTNTAQVRMQ